MAVDPAFAGNVAYASGTTSDVQDIIDAFDAAATGLSPTWTDLTGGLFKSPVDGASRFFDLLFTRIAAGNLEMRVRDDAAATICTRRMQIVSGPQHWWLSVSQFHAWIEVINATPESLGAGLVDLSPRAQTAHSQYTWGRGYRNTSDSSDGTGHQQPWFFMDDNGTPASVRRPIAYDRCPGVTQYTPTMGSGKPAYFPLLMTANFAAQQRVAGRAYNFYFGTSRGDAAVIPIGNAGETGVFRSSALALDSQGLVNMIRIG